MRGVNEASVPTDTVLACRRSSFELFIEQLNGSAVSGIRDKGGVETHRLLDHLRPAAAKTKRPLTPSHDCSASDRPSLLRFYRGTDADTVSLRESGQGRDLRLDEGASRQVDHRRDWADG